MLILLAAVVVHAAACVAAALVAQIQLIVLALKAQIAVADAQLMVARPGATLAAIGDEL